MDGVKMVDALRAERALLEEVIIAMERLARGPGKRWGRPYRTPYWVQLRFSFETRRQSYPTPLSLLRLSIHSLRARRRTLPVASSSRRTCL